MIESDNDRIAKIAHDLWESEGRPHGRDQSHWDAAKEIVALQDSAGDALLPASTGATTPVEEMTVAVGNEGEAPGLTDTGEHDLTAISREPTFKPAPVPAPASVAPKKAAAKRVAAPKDLAKTEEVPAKRKAPGRGKAK